MPTKKPYEPWNTGLTEDGLAEVTNKPVAPVRAGEKLFDVTCVVGSVYADNGSNLSPMDAAFQIVSRHTDLRDSGVYTYCFPDPSGETDSQVNVTVQVAPYTGPRQP